MLPANNHHPYCYDHAYRQYSCTPETLYHHWPVESGGLNTEGLLVNTRDVCRGGTVKEYTCSSPNKYITLKSSQLGLLSNVLRLAYYAQN